MVMKSSAITTPATVKRFYLAKNMPEIWIGGADWLTLWLIWIGCKQKHAPGSRSRSFSESAERGVRQSACLCSMWLWISVSPLLPRSCSRSARIDRGSTSAGPRCSTHCPCWSMPALCVVLSMTAGRFMNLSDPAILSSRGYVWSVPFVARCITPMCPPLRSGSRRSRCADSPPSRSVPSFISTACVFAADARRLS